ncbi:hypothetical protein C8Q77DRAFT_283600 [Trametes polyzona]|nr:hypothetical protein C8Q77DRAFT_283600 [Trametes polyzona]
MYHNYHQRTLSLMAARTLRLKVRTIGAGKTHTIRACLAQSAFRPPPSVRLLVVNSIARLLCPYGRQPATRYGVYGLSERHTVHLVGRPYLRVRGRGSHSGTGVLHPLRPLPPLTQNRYLHPTTPLAAESSVGSTLIWRSIGRCTIDHGLATLTLTKHDSLPFTPLNHKCFHFQSPVLNGASLGISNDLLIAHRPLLTLCCG